MRAILRLILLLAILLPAGLLALAWFSLAQRPLVLEAARLSHQDIARAKAILKQHDPRTLTAGSRRDLHISEQDLNLAANYLLQKYTRGGARISLLPGMMRLSATARLPHLPLRPYLNLSFNLTSDAGAPRLSELAIGELHIPDLLTQWLIAAAQHSAGRSHQYLLVSELIKEARLSSGELYISYEWRPELLDRMRNELLSAAEQQAMAVYHQQLLDLQQAGVVGRGSLATLLPSMFRLAQHRCENPDTDPVAENRSLLIVLGSWAGGRRLDPLLPPAASSRPPAPFRLRLDRRRDFAQHFLISAALAATGDGALADAVGLYKEMADADGGSGFSFTDIAADRSGTRFGELATASPDSARQLQQQMGRVTQETDFMPRIRDLPEHMKGSEFSRRFGGVDSPAYHQMMTEIERRIAACPLYRD